MKNTIAFVMTVIVLPVIFACACAAGGGQVAEILSDDTECLIKISSVQKLFDSLAVTENSVMGRPVENLESVKKRFGFNPFSTGELSANGFDTVREAGIVIDGILLNEEDRKPVYGVSLILPVSEPEKAVRAVRSFLESENQGIEFKTEGKMTAFHIPDQPGSGFFAVKEKYLLVGFNEASDANPNMKSLLAGNTPLPKTGNYKDVAKKVDAGSDVFVYFNGKTIINNNLDRMKNMSQPGAGKPGDTAANASQGLEKELELLKDLEGGGFSFNFGKPDFHAKGVMNMVPGSKSVAVANGLKFNKKTVLGIDEPAALLLSSAFNMSEYDQTMSGNDAAILNNLKDTLQTEYGIDFDKEIKGNLDGNLNLGIYDGMSFNMSNLNAVMTVSIKDEAAMTRVMEKAVTNLPPEKKSMIQKKQVGNQNAYIINIGGGLAQLYIGVKDKNLIVTVGKNLFEKAVIADLAKGFAGKLKDQALRTELQNDAGMLYLDFGEIFSAVSNFLPMLMPPGEDGQPQPVDERLRQTAEKFRYLLMTAKPVGNAVHFDLSVKTKFAGPFFKSVADLAKSFEEKPMTGNTPPQ